jgi:hypothetical protein
MAFQFMCPHGHLLQAEPAHMGQTINCPSCGVLFVIPTVQMPGMQMPAAQAGPPVPWNMAAAPPAMNAPAPPPAQPASEPVVEEEIFPEVRRSGARGARRLDFDVGDSPVEEPAESAEPAEADAAESADLDPMAAALRMVHLRCPNKHELITPYSTMGQEVLCPHCGELFVLQYQNTREYKLEQQRKAEVQDEKLGRRWLGWAVFAGVVVLAMLIGMILYSSHPAVK